MKTRIITRILLVAFVLGGGYRTEEPPAADIPGEVFPGIYMSNNADLRTGENANIALPTESLGFPAGKVYDGLIIFEEFTPMEDACPVK